MDKRYNSSFVGKVCYQLKKVGSTNRYLKELQQRKDVANGTLVLAEFQEEGKGQRGNQWHASAGLNFTGSYLVHPKNLNSENYFLLSKISALAVHDLLHSYELKSHIKWPNDILLNGKKVAGILIENSWLGKEIGSSILGIGLNVNQQSFPNEPNATSIANVTKAEIEMKEIVLRLNHFLEFRFNELMNPQKIKTEYFKDLLGTKEPFRFQFEGKNHSGLIQEVWPTGELIVQTEHQTYQFRQGDIQYLY